MGSETIDIIVGWAAFAAGYTIHYELLYGTMLRQRLERRMSHDSAEIARVLIARGSLVLFFLLVPALLLPVVGGTFRFGSFLHGSFAWDRAGLVAGLIAVIVGLLAVNPGRSRLAVDYPQMRLSEWSGGRVALNLTAWAAYLFAYEWMFRGLLLIPLLPLGMAPAFAINTAIYVAVHVPKGRSEAVGAVVFGLISCYLAVTWGTIWAPFLMHFALSATNSIIAIRENEEMRFV
jgi:hypothetical protein